jgi:membrane protein DedA with SNARE-associated domain
VLDHARGEVRRHAVLTVFLSRWLFSVLGPYVNLIAGGAGVGWRAFTLAAVAGEGVWVAAYLGLGWAAGGQIAAIASLLGNASGLVASAAVTAGLGWALWRRRHQA